MSSKEHIVIFSGAGVSAESGIATFRDADGLWETHRPEDVAHIAAWRRDPELVLRFYNQRWTQLQTVQPNAAHHAIAALEEKFNVTVITQNVDDLHERAGSSKVIHLHGELMKACETHDKSRTYPYAQPLKLGDLGPTGRQLRPFIVVGTSLNVYPAADLVHDALIARRKFLVNKEPALDKLAIRDENWQQFIGPATEGMQRVREVLLG